MDITIVTGYSPEWGQIVDQLPDKVGEAHRHTLFPYHFTRVVLPNLGGALILAHDNEQGLGIGLLFPRYTPPSPVQPDTNKSAYTLRFYPTTSTPLAPEQINALVQGVADRLASIHNDTTIHGDGDTSVVYYDPLAQHNYTPTYHEYGNINIGRPSQAEAVQIRTLHQQIWGSTPEFLYPTDIHSNEFGIGSSLVARVDGTLAAFLFGFYNIGSTTLPAEWQTRYAGRCRLESQTMGVLPAFRGQRIGNLLKMVQAEQARQEGISLVQWTADPLQYANAALNFGLLRAVAYKHYRDYYPFRNELNRVPASRFGLTWLVNSARVQEISPVGSRALIVNLAHHPDIPAVNDGFQQASYTANSPIIAIEIPQNWTQIQQTSAEDALRWRDTTDALFEHYIGRNPGQYVITGVGIDQERRFLIAEQVAHSLWEYLSSQ